MATAPAPKAAELAPSIPPKDAAPTTTTTTTQQQQQFSPRTTSKGAAMPGVSATEQSIQRIAEQGAPPLKLSTTTTTPASSNSSTSTSSKPASGTSTSSARTPASETPHRKPLTATPTRKPLTADPTTTPRPQQLQQRPSTSTGAGDPTPALPPRPPHPHRASSHEKNADKKDFIKKLKKGREQMHADGLKAASFLNKVSHQTWGKLKNQRLVAPGKGHGRHRSASPAHSIGGERDTSGDVDVFGLGLKEAVEKTRAVVERKRGGDATYWMPAIAYRCLQYLNVYGPHELGIYRISGSTSVVDELRAAFKIHHDVDLFENPPDDLHTVSSLLKGWFRALPDAVLPLDVQKRIYEKCKDNTDDTRPPQAFIDELSNLPPYNYYLLHHLFSHLSTICLASDVNKMNLANLGMIFCSTLRIDRFCFNWLVNSWADCWAGCNTEEEEYERTLQLQRQVSSSSDSRDSVERNSSAASRAQAPSPLARSSSRAHSDHHPERERERDRERDNHSPLSVELKKRENDDDRTMSMVVETNGSPRISHRNSVDGALAGKGKQTVVLVRPENQL